MRCLYTVYEMSVYGLRDVSMLYMRYLYTEYGVAKWGYGVLVYGLRDVCIWFMRCLYTVYEIPVCQL